MPVSYDIVPIPRWYFADNTGRPAGGAYMYTYRNLDHVTPKAIYTDATGANAWSNPVFFNANGEAPGPFFWADDEPYFIQIFAADNTLLFTMENYGPAIAGGGGGGGGSTAYNFLENYIVNNVFWRNQGTLNNIQSGTVIAPSNHEGLVYAATAFSTVPYSGSDVLFVRSNNTATDNLVFATADFNAGLVPLALDVTPEFYIDLHCTAAGSETSKAVQFPVDLHVKNLEQQNMTAIVWAKGVSGTQNLTMNFVQYFGTGSATTPVLFPISINASPLTGSWKAYVGNFTVPSVAGKTLGNGGDDASYLQVNFPTAAAFEILFTKPKLYLGTLGSVFAELQSYDYVNRIISTPRTGDIRTSLNSFAPFGWVAANDGTIGSAAPPSGASNRANIDTWPLYSLIWNSVLDHWAPVSTGRGASAIADFSAGKTLTLTRTLGRVLAGTNSGALLNASGTYSSTFTNVGNNITLGTATTIAMTTGTPVQVTGGALPTGIVANVTYFVTSGATTTAIQLSSTIENAYAGTPITLSSNASGTIQSALGAYRGESEHTQTMAELAAHTHTIPVSNAGIGVNTAAYAPNTGVQNISSGTTGSSTPFNVIQPSTNMNVFIKL